MGSSGDFAFALLAVGVVRLTQVRPGNRWVHSGSPWGSLGSSGVVEFTWVRPGCRCVDMRSLGSLGFTLGVVGSFRFGWVYSGSPLGSLGSSGVAGFTQVGPGSPAVHAESQGSLRFPLGVVGFILGRWVHSVSPWGSLCSFGITGITRVCLGDVRFTWVRPGGRCVHPGSLGSLVFALGVVGFIWCRWVHAGLLG